MLQSTIVSGLEGWEALALVAFGVDAHATLWRAMAAHPIAVRSDRVIMWSSLRATLLGKQFVIGRIGMLGLVSRAPQR